MSKEPPETEAPQELSAKEIKEQLEARKDGKVIQLPSGLSLKLRKPSIARLLKDDVFPKELVATAIKMDSNASEPTTKEDYLNSLRVINTIVAHAVVSVKVVLDKADVTEDSILVDDIDDNDRVAIYLYCQSGVEPLNSFRS